MLARARKESQVAQQASAGYAFHDLPLLAFRKAQRGRGKIDSKEKKNTAAKAKEGYVPHDCQQDDFSSGPLESLNTLPIPPLWPAINLEMIQKKEFSAGRTLFPMNVVCIYPTRISGLQSHIGLADFVIGDKLLRTAFDGNGAGLQHIAAVG